MFSSNRNYNAMPILRRLQKITFSVKLFIFWVSTCVTRWCTAGCRLAARYPLNLSMNSKIIWMTERLLVKYVVWIFLTYRPVWWCQRSSKPSWADRCRCLGLPLGHLHWCRPTTSPSAPQRQQRDQTVMTHTGKYGGPKLPKPKINKRQLKWICL